MVVEADYNIYVKIISSSEKASIHFIPATYLLLKIYLVENCYRYASYLLESSYTFPMRTTVLQLSYFKCQGYMHS